MNIFCLNLSYLFEWLIRTFLAISMNQRMGVAEQLFTSNVSRILGKKARSIYEFAADHAPLYKKGQDIII